MQSTGVTLIAATRIEVRALLRAMPPARVVECGIALSRCEGVDLGDTVISCGLAGGLRSGLRTGSIVIPQCVRRPDGSEFACDTELLRQLVTAARDRGYEPLTAPLLTSVALVRGTERERWARMGYAAVDMETGLLNAARIAAVRVVLDTPERELSATWLHPGRAMLDPRNWAQARWLAREAPRCSAIAAEIIAAACRPVRSGATSKDRQ